MSFAASAGVFDPAAALGERLDAIYRDIASGPMLGLPVCNPRLEVQAVGFRLHEGYAIGAIVTPWCMNVVVAGVADGPALPEARLGDSRAVQLPAGTIEVIVGELPGFGRLDAASLFSPMFAFDDADAAREAAAAAMAALFGAAPHGTVPARDALAATVRDRRALLFGRGALQP
jgi:[NiFe] hydrogenase assembly HybE family chaperone